MEFYYIFYLWERKWNKIKLGFSIYVYFFGMNKINKVK